LSRRSISLAQRELDVGSFPGQKGAEPWLKVCVGSER
jgi:hypothetical protein